MVSVIPNFTFNITLHGTAYVFLQGIPQSIAAGTANVLEARGSVKIQ